MFTIEGKYGKINNVAATANEHQYSVFPVLTISYQLLDGQTSEYIIQRANWGMPGYYVNWHTIDESGERSNNGIYTGYLTEELSGVDLASLPETVLKSLIRNYVLVAISNLFSRRGWLFQAHTYNNKNLPKEFNEAIEKFVELEFEQIRSK